MPATSPSVLYGLLDVLRSAGVVYPEYVGGVSGEPLLDVRIVAENRAPFRCVTGNVVVEPHASIATIGRVDVAIVCDLNMPIDIPPKGRYSAETAWLRQVHAGGALVGSVCTGSLMLAEAGLLDGRRCAGHWAFRDLFRTAYPKVEFVIDAILCLDNEMEGLDHRRKLRLVARTRALRHRPALRERARAGRRQSLSPFRPRGWPAAFCNDEPARAEGGRRHRSLSAWIADNYSSANPVGAMVEQAGLNRRTFVRRFRAATGYLPLEYVHRLRVEEAKQIIEREAEHLDEVGAMVGYDDPAFFRRLFKRQTGLTPAAYRRKFAPIMSLASGVSKQRH